MAKYVVFDRRPLLQAYSQYRTRFLRGIGIAAGWFLVVGVRFVVLPLIPMLRWLGIMMDVTAWLLYELVQVIIEAMERRD